MANDDILKELTDNVVHLASADSSTLKQFLNGFLKLSNKEIKVRELAKV
jgi:hypothetical protein